MGLEALRQVINNTSMSSSAIQKLIYFRDISSTDSLIVGTLGIGEGWHNYHVSYFKFFVSLELLNNRLIISTSFLGTTKRRSRERTFAIYHSHSLTFSLGLVSADHRIKSFVYTRAPI